jgi:hypothetical protein
MFHFWQQRIECFKFEIKDNWINSITFFDKSVVFPVWMMGICLVAGMLIPFAFLYDLSVFLFHKLKKIR